MVTAGGATPPSATDNWQTGTRGGAAAGFFLRNANLFPFHKAKSEEADDVRPIAVGESLRRLIGKALLRPAATRAEALKVLTPLQWGVIAKSGLENVAVAATIITEQDQGGVLHV